MADSTVSEINKMKVVDLRKELKIRGLPTTGDKSELVARLQTAMAQANDSNDEHGDINLDSDIDSDGVLEDEDDKSQGDILDDSAVDTLSEELALAEQPAKTETKPHRTLKRKITAPDTTTDKADGKNVDKNGDKEPTTKKIVLNRTISVTSTKPTEEKTEQEKAPDTAVVSNKVKITADIDSKSKLESRAKRFGLPVQMSEAERKEARMKRFGQMAEDSTSKSSISIAPTGTLTENLDKLKKRSERFGLSVSKIMTDIENKEKLEKRKAKFSAA